jgi:hypothetical protein
MFIAGSATSSLSNYELATLPIARFVNVRRWRPGSLPRFQMLSVVKILGRLSLRDGGKRHKHPQGFIEPTCHERGLENRTTRLHSEMYFGDNRTPYNNHWSGVQ